MESIFDELDKKVIAPQKFWLAIVVCIIIIGLAYGYHLVNDADRKEMTFLVTMAMGIVIVAFSNKYLRNFTSGKARYWVKWLMAVYILFVVVPGAYDLVSKMDIPYAYKLSAYNIYSPLYFMLLAAYYFVVIMLGIALLKIPDDFIGLLRPLAWYYIFPMPLAAAIGVASSYSVYIKTMIAGHELLFHMVLTTIQIVPTLLLAVIFYRAMQYRKMKENILGAHRAEQVTGSNERL